MYGKHEHNTFVCMLGWICCMHVSRLVSRLIFKAIKRFRRSEPGWKNARLRCNTRYIICPKFMSNVAISLSTCRHFKAMSAIEIYPSRAHHWKIL